MKYQTPYPKGVQQYSLGQSEAAHAAKRRPRLRGDYAPESPERAQHAMRSRRRNKWNATLPRIVAPLQGFLILDITYLGRRCALP